MPLPCRMKVIMKKKSIKSKRNTTMEVSSSMKKNYLSSSRSSCNYSRAIKLKKIIMVKKTDKRMMMMKKKWKSLKSILTTCLRSLSMKMKKAMCLSTSKDSRFTLEKKSCR